MLHSVDMSAGDPGRHVGRSHDAVDVLEGVIRRHIERLQMEEVSHPRSAYLLRQYRDYGYGLIGMLAAYCDEVGVACPSCIELALKLQQAMADAVMRVNDMSPTRRDPTGVRRVLPRRTSFKRGDA